MRFRVLATEWHVEIELKGLRSHLRCSSSYVSQKIIFSYVFGK